MNQQRPTPTVEDYLGIIYILERDGESIFSSRLARWLDVSAPTVTATVKRMVRDGWISVDKQKEIVLTPAGRNAAQSLMRRHMLSEVLLNQVLGVPWSQVHQEADEMEHTISPDTVERMLARLDDPQTCPHGNPLPGHESLLDESVPITQIETGQRLIIRRIHESAEENPEILAYLETHNLIPGTEALVMEVMPFNQTITLRVANQLVVLGLAVAEHIFATPQ